MKFELINAILLVLGAITAVLINIAIIIGAYVNVLRQSDYSWLAIIIVAASALMYAGSSLFPKFGSTKRRYLHIGLLKLLRLLDDQPERKSRAFQRIAKAQDSLGGDPDDP